MYKTFLSNVLLHKLQFKSTLTTAISWTAFPLQRRNCIKIYESSVLLVARFETIHQDPNSTFWENQQWKQPRTTSFKRLTGITLNTQRLPPPLPPLRIKPRSLGAKFVWSDRVPVNEWTIGRRHERRRWWPHADLSMAIVLEMMISASC